jgi:hypothetical protein
VKNFRSVRTSASVKIAKFELHHQFRFSYGLP